MKGKATHHEQTLGLRVTLISVTNVIDQIHHEMEFVYQILSNPFNLEDYYHY
jgi:hypothetical protein